jgi:hypothetical protein
LTWKNFRAREAPMQMSTVEKDNRCNRDLSLTLEISEREPRISEQTLVGSHLFFTSKYATLNTTR